MAFNKKPWYSRWGINVKGDSWFNDILEIRGSLKFTADGRMFVPEGDGTNGGANEMRISTVTDQLEIFRNGTWVPVVTSSVRYDPNNTEFFGNRGSDEVTIPHVNPDNEYLSNVPKYRANSSGTTALPSYAFNDSTNSGMNYDKTREYTQFIHGGDVQIEAKTGIGLRLMHKGEGIRITETRNIHYRDTTFNEAVLLLKTLNTRQKLTVEFGGLEVQNGNLEVTTGDLMVTSGKIQAGDNVIAYSDIRIKKDRKRIKNATGIIKKANGYTYFNEATGRLDLGFLAQEMKEAAPVLVDELGSVEVNGRTIENFMGVRYGNAVAIVWQSQSELIDRIEKLEKMVAELSQALADKKEV